MLLVDSRFCVNYRSLTNRRWVLAQLVVLAPEENNSNCVDCGGTIDDEQATYRGQKQAWHPHEKAS
jgi:hypothetical protein